MRKTWLIFSQAVTVSVAVLFVLSTFKPQWVDALLWRLDHELSAPAPLPTGKAMPVALETTGFRHAAQRAAPAVVSVLTANKPNPTGRRREPWFQYFFGDRQTQPQAGIGSGVIVSPAGYVLTNNHVVEGMDEIEVMLSDGRRGRARVVGTDADTDLAVLKVSLPHLNAINWGDSEQLQVGDSVLAIGNPFGVGQTVTAGIVSALGRNQLGINTFENFIQTDAAINPGNSGGALVDAQGRLVGINSAIYSRSGGNLGIGFAIPVSTARQIMDSLIRDGQVTRGWIGVEPRDLTPEMVETFNLKLSEGVLITGVLRDGPAARGGLQPGDVVTSVAGHAVNSTSELLTAVAALHPGQPAELHLQRGDERLAIRVVAARRPASASVASRQPQEDDEQQDDEGGDSQDDAGPQAR